MGTRRQRRGGARVGLQRRQGATHAHHFGQERAGVGWSRVGIARGRALYQRVDGRRNARHKVGRRGHRLVGVPVRDRDRRVAVVGRPTSQHLEKHDPGRVDVASRIGDATGDLFRGEVGDRADQRGGACGGVSRGGAGQPEVGDLHATVVGEQYVFGLDVAVHQTRRVGGRQRGQHWVQDRQGLLRLEVVAFAQQVAKRAALHVLHRQEHLAVVLALIENRHYVRVRQPRRRPGFADEARDELVVFGVDLMHHL